MIEFLEILFSLLPCLAILVVLVGIIILISLVSTSTHSKSSWNQELEDEYDDEIKAMVHGLENIHHHDNHNHY